MSKGLTVFLIDYNTKRSDWKMLLNSPSLLDMTLPNNVETKKWDVILVDGPDGQNDQSTGRMKSIFLSSRLIKDSGDIFVHDCNREVEDIYCNRFLKKENLKIEIKGPVGCLRHYHITNRST
jgi:glucuronoxylan 4-O-methyltransferase